MLECHLQSVKMWSVWFECLLVLIKFQPPMFLQNTVYCLWILCPTVGKHTGWIIDSIPIFFAPNHRLHLKKPQHTVWWLLATSHWALQVAKFGNPSSVNYNLEHVLNYVVFLSLSVHKHSCHIIVHTCTYRHTLYLMTYSCPVWHSEYYRICSTFQNYFLDFTHFSIICNFRKSTARHKR